MSTKIFVHKPRKIKPPKLVDLSAVEEEAALRLARARSREEAKRIMAELRAEELAQRAAKMPPPKPVETYHCPYCWASDKALAMVRRDHKLLNRLYRGIVKNRPELIADPWRECAELELADKLEKLAKLERVALNEAQIAEVAVKAINKTIKIVEEEKPKIVLVDKLGL